MKLVGAHALLAGAQQMKRQEPLAKWDVTVSEDSAHGDGELLTAPGTLPHASADVLVFLGFRWLQAIRIVQFAAVRADRAFRPPLLFQKFAGFIFIAEMLGECHQIEFFCFHALNLRLDAWVCQVYNSGEIA